MKSLRRSQPGRCARPPRPMAVPFLSVVMPSFKGAQWIANALNSVRAQEDSGIEVTVVDGDEDPATEQAVAPFQSDLNIRYFRRPDLATWQAKTNFAVAQASADHIAMLHVDDLWLPGRAAAVRKWIAGNPAAVCHLSPSELIDLDGRRIATWRCPFEPSEQPIPRNRLTERLLVQNFISCPAPVCQRSVRRSSSPRLDAPHPWRPRAGTCGPCGPSSYPPIGSGRGSAMPPFRGSPCGAPEGFRNVGRVPRARNVRQARPGRREPLAV